MIQEDYLSTQQVAARLGLTDGRIRQMLLAGEIEARKLGQRVWAIPVSEVERLLRLRDKGRQATTRCG